MTARIILLSLVAATFLATFLVSGHVGVLVGWLLLKGITWEAWRYQVVSGWSAVALLLWGAATTGGWRGSIAHVAVCVSVASWASFVYQTETPLLTLVSSVPFGLCVAAWFMRTLWQWVCGKN